MPNDPLRPRDWKPTTAVGKPQFLQFCEAQMIKIGLCKELVQSMVDWAHSFFIGIQHNSTHPVVTWLGFDRSVADLGTEAWTHFDQRSHNWGVKSLAFSSFKNPFPRDLEAIYIHLYPFIYGYLHPFTSIYIHLCHLHAIIKMEDSIIDGLQNLMRKIPPFFQPSFVHLRGLCWALGLALNIGALGLLASPTSVGL